MSIDRAHLITVSIIFLIVHLALYHYHGVRLGNDSPRYIEWSNQLDLLRLNIFDWRFWYLSYVIFIAPVIKLGLPLEAIITCQIIIAYVACLCLYQITLQLSSEKRTALLATCTYLLWLEIPSWNFYLLTETLFTSCIIITYYLLLKHKQHPIAKYSIIPFLILTAMIRPMGITVLIASVIFFYYEYQEFFKRYLNWPVKAALILIPVLTLLLLLEAMPNVHFFYSNGQIVWGADQVPELKNNPWLRIDNSHVIYPSEDLPGFIKFAKFSIDNFGFQCELFFKKAVMFLLHAKPYYSAAHNLFILLTLPFVYFFSFYGLSFHRVSIGARKFALSLFFLNLIMTGLTVEAWDGRFLIPMLPILIIFGSIGLTSAIKTRGLRWSMKNRS